MIIFNLLRQRKFDGTYKANAQPVQQNQLNRSAAQYQKVTIEPPRTQQFQQLRQQRQVNAPNDLTVKPAASASLRSNGSNPAKFDGIILTEAIGSNTTNSRKPSGTAPKRVKENTDWKSMPELMPQQQPTIQKKPVVNSDGNLPDYIRNIAGFEIRVIRSKDPDMRLFPC